VPLPTNEGLSSYRIAIYSADGGQPYRNAIHHNQQARGRVKVRRVTERLLFLEGSALSRQFTCAMKVLRYPQLLAATTARWRINARGITAVPGKPRRNAMIFPSPAGNRAVSVRFPTGDIQTPQSDRAARFAVMFNEVGRASGSGADSPNALGAAAARWSFLRAGSRCKFFPKAVSTDSRIWRTEKEK
jgi:hypothetical protein